MNDARYPIRQVADCFSLAVSALRYYDQIGLLASTERRGNIRYYDHDQLRRLTLIKLLHHDGLVSLDDTSTLLADPPPTSTPAGREILTATVNELDRKIRHLAAARQVLQHLLECPADDPVRQCPYLHERLDNTVDAALHSPNI